MALRLITDLERIGDEAINITERTVRDDGDAKSLVGGDLAAMAGAARDMLHEALDAFVQADCEAAESVLGRDEAVDRRCATVIAAMVAHMSRNPAEVRAGLRVIRVAKYLERIADHATNVAEQVIFMVRGDDVRHGQWRRYRLRDPGQRRSPGPVVAVIVFAIRGDDVRRGQWRR